MRISLLFMLALYGCGQHQRTVALNWFARLELAPACGEDQMALIAGQDTLLCSVERMIFSGDSLVVRAEDNCYFVDLQAITEYKRQEDLMKINCSEFDDFIKGGRRGWPAGTLREEDAPAGH